MSHRGSPRFRPLPSTIRSPDKPWTHFVDTLRLFRTTKFGVFGAFVSNLTGFVCTLCLVAAIAFVHISHLHYLGTTPMEGLMCTSQIIVSLTLTSKLSIPKHTQYF